MCCRKTTVSVASPEPVGSTIRLSIAAGPGEYRNIGNGKPFRQEIDGLGIYLHS